MTVYKDSAFEVKPCWGQQISKLLAILLFAVMVSPNVVDASPVIFVDFPQRPSNAAKIKAAAGTLIDYRLVTTSDEVREELTLRDAHSGTLRKFLLSSHTLIDGQTFRCAITLGGGKNAIADLVNREGYCRQLPADLTPGKTKIALAYWDADETSKTPLFDPRLPATDYIISLPDL